MARPLYTAPAAELSTATTACVPLTAGFQPRIVPLSVAKMKRAGPEVVPFVTTKLGPPLKTTPVGAPATPTRSGIVAPVLPLYSVDESVPLSATHQGDVVLATSPQALTRAGSTWSAGTAPSDTRLCCA